MHGYGQAFWRWLRQVISKPSQKPFCCGQKHYLNKWLVRLRTGILPAIIWLFFMVVSGPVTLRAQTLPSGFSSSPVSAQWDQAVGLTFSQDGSQMFVWEKAGKVWVVKNNQRKLLLDISEEVGDWRDFGLLGFTLDPQFSSNGYFYLLYTVDRHYLLHYGTSSYSSTTNDYYKATIGRVTRYAASQTPDGYSVSAASRKILLGATPATGIPSLHQSHGIGSLVFGADGTLLVSAGDGASYASTDVGSATETYYAQALTDGIITKELNVGAFRSQMLESTNGKILRINPETGSGIPSNPFYDQANPHSVHSKIWALGLRNPFRMIIKPGTGSVNAADANPGILYVGDVGNGNYEELNIVTRPGMNFGWPLFEGLTAQSSYPGKKVFHNYAPNPLYGVNGCTQQYFYFQDLIKQETISGTALFTNPCNSGQPVPSSVKTFVHSRPAIDWRHTSTGPSRTGTFSGQTATFADIGAAGSPVPGPQFGGNAAIAGVFYPHSDFPAIYQNTCFFGDYVGKWIRSMAVDGSNKPVAVNNFLASGAVVVAMAVNPTQTGIYYINYPSEIRKISYNSVNTPPNAVASADKLFGTSPLTVQFTGSQSSDPEGQSLTYAWNFGDGTTSNLANPSHTFTNENAVKYTVTLTVTDSKGSTDNSILTISLTANTPPQVTITSPVANTLYPLTQETTYNLRATVTDQEQSNGELTYKWQTILHHDNHEHAEPFDTAPETTTTLDPVGCGGETYYYRIILTVTDSDGLSGQDEVRLYPDCNTTTQRTTNYILVNADTEEDIETLHDGTILDLADLPTTNLNIRAETFPATVGSLVFHLTGSQTRTHTENTGPYALFGKNNADFNSWNPVAGNYNLTATPYSSADGAGTVGTPLSIDFTVVTQSNVNHAPVADAGSDMLITSSSTSVQLNGSGSDTDGSIGNFSWSQISGPNTAIFTSKTIAAPTVSNLKAGTYIFSLIVKDDLGLTSNPDQVEVKVNQATTQALVAYILVNADTDQDLQLLPNGTTLNLATLPTKNLNIRATTNPAVIGSVIFNVSGQLIRKQTESTAPYAVFSESNGNYAAWVPTVGTYTVKGTPYMGAAGSGTAGIPLTITFNVINQPATLQYSLTVNTTGSGSVTKNPDQTTYASGTVVKVTATPRNGYVFTGWSGAATGTTNPLPVTMTSNKTLTANFVAATGQQVVSFTLINATTDQPIRDLMPDDVLSISADQYFNIRANTNPVKVGSVKFALSGPQTKATTETGAPYALFGDVSGNYNNWSPAVGSYTLKATPYSASGGTGAVGTPLTITFQVVRQAGIMGARSNKSTIETGQAQRLPEEGGALLTYPTPTLDGHLKVDLRRPIEGEVTFTLMSGLGEKLITGWLPLAQPTSVLPFDFSKSMSVTGVYYLLVENKSLKVIVKIMRQ
ncbi:Xanthomonalisin [Adhaeribacter pallidiroseus]|uniref:Xanthomonalisin n=2 Tax=Adhaeribacter pallidiroseus TaxID=2072847 RepID=A0A369QIT4_9BACT|nr:Xanthomonalisin [Adhaeribacter pallidiroseus]